MGKCTDQFTDIYCEKFAMELDVLLATLQGIEKMMRVPIKKLKTMLEALVNKVPSDAGALAAKLAKLNTQIDLQIPGTDCANELFAIANKCNLIKQDIQIKGINGLTFDLGGPLNGMINKTLSDFKKYMLGLIEYPVAVYADTVDELLKKAKIKKMLDTIAEYETCANAVCSGRLTDQIAQLHQIIKDLYISEDTGLLDMNELYQSLSNPLDVQVRSNINMCIQNIRAQKEAALSKLTDSVNSIVNAKNAISNLF